MSVRKSHFILSRLACAIADCFRSRPLVVIPETVVKKRKSLSVDPSLILATALFAGLVPGHASNTVKIGAGETKSLTSLLAANPYFKLSDIQFTSSHSNNPGTLVIDQNSSNLTGQLGDSKHHGRLNINNGITLTLQNYHLDGAKHLGGAFSFNNDFTVSGPGSLVMKNNYVTGDGGAVWSNSALTFTGPVSFIGNQVDYQNNGSSSVVTKRPEFGQGGAIWVHKNLVLGNNAIFRDNTSSGGSGGAIYSKSGNVSFGNDALLTGNKSVLTSLLGKSFRSEGGAIYASKNVSFASNATLNNNEASSGGAIYSGGQVTFGSGATLNANQSLGGYNYQGDNGGEGGAIHARNSISFADNATLDGNSARAQGGAIYVYEGKAVFGNGAHLSGNSANSDGGAIYTGKRMSFTDNSVWFGDRAVLSGNSAKGYGGAIFADDGIGDAVGGAGSIRFGNDASLTNNSSINQSGGAIYVPTLSVTFSDNATLSGNTAQNYGGAIHSDRRHVSFGNGARLNNNSVASHDGGAIYVPKSYVTFGRGAELGGNESTHGIAGAIYVRDDISFLDDAYLHDNRAPDTGWGYGGAIYSVKGTVSFGARAVISANLSGKDGGAIWSMKNVTFGANATLGNNSSGNSGGAIHTQGSMVSFGSGAVLSGNQAGTYGGAISASAASISIGNDATLSANTASLYDGGAIYAPSQQTFFGDQATLNGNKANRSGGAVYAHSTISFGNNASLNSNIATTGSGGALYTPFGDAKFLDNATLTGNQAALEGGAILTLDGAVFGKGATLSGNTATAGHGGAIYAGDYVSFTDDATLNDNTAGNDGGAIFSEYSAASFGNHATLSGNQSGNSGGAIRAYQSVTFGSDAVLSSNTALRYGGAIYSNNSSVTFGDRATLMNNVATNYDGGAVRTGDYGSLNFGNDATFSENIAGGSGGALYTKNGKASFGANAVFTDNRAGLHGGALYAYNVELGGNVNGGTPVFSGNRTQTGSGGAIYAGDTLTIRDGAVFSGNHAGSLGGAIYAGNKVSMTAKTGDILFYGNTAGSTANALYLNSSGELDLNAATGRTIAFDDPVTGSGSRVLVRINGDSDSGGTIRFSKYESGLAALTDVYKGTFELAEGAVFGTRDSKFRLHSGATLAAGGGSTLAGNTIDIEGGSTLAFDLASVTAPLAHTSSEALLNLGAQTNLYGNKLVGIDLRSLNRAGTYILINNWGTSTQYDTKVTIRGHLIENTRIHNPVVKTEGNNLVLTLEHYDNLALTWTGSHSDIWSVVEKGNGNTPGDYNWIDSPTTGRLFLHGDAVTFNDSASEKNIVIDKEGVVVGDMTVDSGNYTFSGGTITADSQASTLSGSAGTLTVKSGASADFSTIVGNNEFEHIDLAGKLILGETGHLGTGFSHVNFTGNAPEVNFDKGTFLFAGNGSAHNRIDYAESNGLLTLKTQNDGRVAFFNSVSTADGGALAIQNGNADIGNRFAFLQNETNGNGGSIYAGQDITLGSTSFFLNNTAHGNGGSLNAGGTVQTGEDTTFTGNMATTGSGGAVYAINASFGENARFSANTAGTNGGAVNTLIDTTLDASALLSNNTAFSDGGAIYAGQLASIGDNAIFSGNTATGGKGGAVSANKATFGEYVTLASNTAGTEGGAIHVITDVTIGDAALLSSNRTDGDGGGIFTGQDVTLGEDVTFRLNHAGKSGGAIYATNDALAGTGATFTGNSTSSDNGGAIFAGNNVTVGNDALLRFNAAGADGGAIYATNTVTLSDKSRLNFNKAASNGGAVYAGQNLSIGSAAGFSNNTAGENGGAIYAANAMTIVDGGNFLNNTAENGQGGAIYAGKELSINALTHDAVFSGNTAGGTANAIHMGDGATLNLSASADRTIALNDPVSGGTIGGNVDVHFNQDSSATGTIRLSEQASDITASTTVHHGVLELADGARWGNTISGTSFTLDSSATLKVSGSDSAEVSAENIAFKAGSKLAFDPASHQGTGSVLTLNGNVTADGSTAVSISSLVRHKGAELVLVQAGTTDFKVQGLGNDNLYYKQVHVVDTRLNGILQLDTDTPGSIILKQTKDIVNLDLVWKGDKDGNWNFITRNWINSSTGYDSLFLDGDTVLFDNRGMTQDVTVNEHGVSVAGMTVAEGNYHFTGGAIENDGFSSLTEMTGLTGMLTVMTGASASFANDMAFANGYQVQTGAVMSYSGSSIEGNIVNDGTFTFDTTGTAPLAYTGQIGGNGQLIKTGDGRLELGGLVTQAGMDIQAGTLSFSRPDAAISTSGGIVIRNGAAIETGQGGFIGGNLTLDNGAILSLSGTRYLTVSGTADLSDTIVAQQNWDGWQADKIYPVFKAADYAQDFASRSLDWDGGTGTLMRNGSYLVYLTGTSASIWPKGMTFNQKQALQAVASLPTDSPVRDMLVLDEQQAAAAADLASGEGHASTRNALMVKMRAEPLRIGNRLAKLAFRQGMGLDQDALKSALQDKPASRQPALSERLASTYPALFFTEPYPSDTPSAPLSDNGLWAEIGDSHQSVSGDGNAARNRLYGPEMAVGFDSRVENGWLWGASTRYADLKSTVDERQYEADVKTWGLSLYGGREIDAGPGSLRLLGGASYAWSRIDAERGTAFSDPTPKRMKSNYDARAWQVFAEAAYGISLSAPLRLEPFMNLTYTQLRTDGFEETGGRASLKSNTDTLSNTTSTLGLRLNTRIKDTVSVNASLGWMHAYGSSNPAMRHAFVEGGGSFFVKGVDTGRNTAVVGLGATVALDKTVSLSLSYDGVIGGSETAHAGTASLNWRW